MGVSVSTVVEAYERLAAEGLIARAGSGFYVSGPAAPLALAEMEPGWTARWTRCGCRGNRWKRPRATSSRVRLDAQ
jgi:DNA-binding transcriptional MocR family regulator